MSNEMVIIQKAELIELIRSAVSAEMKGNTGTQAPNPKIKGIHGLAEALHCSVAKAQSLKNSGTIRFFQDGKLILFDYNQVIEDLKGKDLNKRGRKAGAIRK